MYKTDIVRSVAKDTRLSQRMVNEVLTASLAAITQALGQGRWLAMCHPSAAICPVRRGGDDFPNQASAPNAVSPASLTA